MIKLLSIIGIAWLFTTIAISMYVMWHTYLENKTLRKNKKHLDEAARMMDAYHDTKDTDYLKYSLDELKKIK